jgi:HD-GYP domain-containing protein (c-di-GMP phosphodiesterase class II)
VADTIDAMISERPYRGTISSEAVLRELDKEAGFQFDPNVGQVARKLIDQGLLKLGAPAYAKHTPAADKK